MTSKTKLSITKQDIDQLERDIMSLVPSGKPYAAFKQQFKDFREATGIGGFR